MTQVAPPQEGLVELVLYCMKVPRSGEDPPSIEARAIVFYGEGRFIAEVENRVQRIDSKKRGLLVLSFAGEWQTLRSRLVDDFWDVEGTSIRVLLGLIERPPILSLAPPDPLNRALFGQPEVIRNHFTFVRAQKSDVISKALARYQDQPQAILESWLDRLRTMIGKDLRGKHAECLGDVYILEEAKVPIARWSTVVDHDLSCKGIRVVLRGAVAEPEVQINVELLGTDYALLSDEIRVWRPGDPLALDFSATQQIGAASVRVWCAGTLVYQSTNPIVLDVSIGGNKTKIAFLEDSKPRISRKDTRNGAWWNQSRDAALEIFGSLRPSLDVESYFAPTAEGRSRAFESIGMRISTAANCFLVDPYFDAAAAGPLLENIKNKEAHIEVLTCLKPRAEKELLTFLCNQELSGALHSNLTIYNLKGTGKSFHDRYLVTQQMFDSFPSLLILTNSLNNLANRHPLVVAEVPLRLSYSILHHLRSLYEAAKVQGSLWSSTKREQERRRESLKEFRFQGWHSLVKILMSKPLAMSKNKATGGFQIGKRIFSRQPRPHSKQERDLVDAAITHGLMKRESSGALSWLIREWLHIDNRAVRLQAALTSAKNLQPTTISDTVGLIGNLVARGFELDAEAVARVVTELPGAASCRQTLVNALLGGTHTIPATQDHIWDLGSTTPGLAESAFYHWLGRAPFRRLSMKWHRKFQYEVLIHLDAKLALDCATTTRDMIFVETILGVHSEFSTEWPQTLTDACAASPLPFVRALAAQSLANSGKRWIHSHITPPPDPAKTAVELEQRGFSPRERCCYFANWSRNQAENPDSRAECARQALLAATQASDPPLLESLFRTWGTDSFFVDVALAAGANELILDAIVRRFGARLTPGERESGYLVFTDSSRSETDAVADCVARLATMRSTEPRLIIEDAVGWKKHMQILRKPSPLMSSAPNTSSSTAAAWASLWELQAVAKLKEDPGRARLLERAQEKAFAYLGSAGGHACTLEFSLLEAMFSLDKNNSTSEAWAGVVGEPQTLSLLGRALVAAEIADSRLGDLLRELAYLPPRFTPFVDDSVSYLEQIVSRLPVGSPHREVVRGVLERAPNGSRAKRLFDSIGSTQAEAEG